MANLSILSKSYYVVFGQSLSFVGSFPCLHDQREALLEFKDILVCSSMRDTADSSHRFVSWWLRDMEFQFKTFVFPTPAKTPAVLALIFRIKILMSLDISYNSIQGEISGIGVGYLSELVHLDINGNMIDRELPNDDVGLTSLNRHWELGESNNIRLEQELFEWRNPIVDTDAEEAVDISSGERYAVCGEFPDFFSQLSSLQVLDLRNNSIDGSTFVDMLVIVPCKHSQIIQVIAMASELSHCKSNQVMLGCCPANWIASPQKQENIENNTYELDPFLASMEDTNFSAEIRSWQP
ncbi:hypothetical protein F3Y22_tig00007058pilonHSYRG00005 [Hibiscus syriacus]|uniref:Uncharacterized protein n=1 Tax=Hibiscus syriacus TaxID=106335 RepID=A0A6A3CCC5_HIBSY|nr:hypothetical protein F3Y22_tig00007058pilonHSYRG00005 [Hibiscus syriacus]